MARTQWVGKAQAVAGVYEATIPSISAGQRIGLSINNKTVSYTAVAGDTVKTAAAGLASAWNASTEPEHAELTAAASGDKVRLTADEAGVPHTITSDSTGGTGAEITITRLQGAASAVNQKQYVALPAGATAGTWGLDFHYKSTTTIAYNATAAAVQTHLEGLTEIGVGDVTVSGDAGGPYTIEFTGNLAGTKMPTLLVDATGLTLPTSAVTVDIEESDPWLNNVMAWEVTKPGNAWALKQGTDETWVLGSDATLEEIEQAVAASLSIGDVRVERAVSTTGTTVYRIYRRGDRSYTEPDEALVLVTWTDDGATAGRAEVNATIYQDPADIDPTTDRTIAWNVRFRPNLKVVGQAMINGVQGAAGALTLYDPDATALDGASSLKTSVESALSAADSGDLMSYTAADFTVAVAWLGEGPTHGQDLSVTLTYPTTTAAIDPLDLSISVSTVTGVRFFADVTQVAVAGKPEVHKITLDNATGGTYTLTNNFGAGNETTAAIAYNATAAAVESAIEALVSVAAADIAVYGNTGGPYTLVWGGAYDDTVVNLFTATSSLTNTPAVTLSVSTKVEATGPNHFDAAKNWSGGAVPSTGDTLVFRDTSVPLLYGLSQSGTTPAAMEFHESFLGTVGLPDTNENDYPEYRTTALRIGEAADAQTIAISVRGGSSRIRLDTGDCPVTLQISDTGISDNGEPAALRWTGTAATNTVVYLSGSVFLGSEQGSAATVGTLRISGTGGGYGALELASGLSITTVQHTGGDVSSRATIATANLGGAWTQDGGSVTTLTTLPGGSVTILGSPTITTLDIGSAGSVDFSGANAPTATTTRLSAGGELLDPQGAVTFTNGIALVLCGLADVTLDVGQGKTITVA